MIEFRFSHFASSSSFTSVQHQNSLESSSLTSSGFCSRQALYLNQMFDSSQKPTEITCGLVASEDKQARFRCSAYVYLHLFKSHWLLPKMDMIRVSLSVKAGGSNGRGKDGEVVTNMG